MKPPITFAEFRRRLRIYYGAPAHPQFASRLWREAKAGDSKHPAVVAATTQPGLRPIGEALRTQDNRMTSHPIFMVQRRRRIYGIEHELAGNFVWLLDGEECDPHEKGSRKVGYVDIWTNAQPFFTEAAAKDYLEANRHNLGEARIYVESGWRNGEWQAVRNFLIKQ